MENTTHQTLKPAADSGPAENQPPAHPLDALLARLPGFVYRCRHDSARTVELATAGCQTLLGVTNQELVRAGRGLMQFVHPADRKRVQREIAESLAERDTFACEYRLHRASAQQFVTVWEQGRAVRDPLGKIIALEGYLGDLAGTGLAGGGQRGQEFQIRQDRAIKSINMLAGGIAHDFNNAIAGILGSAEVIKMDAPPGQPDDPILDQIFTVGNRARSMIQQLREFSQRPPCARILIFLSPVVEAALNAFRSRLAATVELSQQLEPDCPAIFADAAQIQLAVINLCSNASHSLAGRQGRIEVRLENVAIAVASPADKSGPPTGPHLRLSVRDNGEHFSKSVLGRMFEPFACKHMSGHNSGLELFTVQEIVHAHGGEITVASAPGEGTVFQLYFPVPENNGEGKTVAG